MLFNQFNLDGKVALVTGGSKGLGKAMARAFAEAVADMTKRDEVKRLAKSAVDAFGRVDILVNNAGTNKPQAIDQIDDKTWDEVLEINLSSVMALTRALVPQMKERRWGRIIHISSVMGVLAKE